MELLIFKKWYFQIYLEYKPLPFAMGSNNISSRVYVDVVREKKNNFVETAVVPKNINNMSSSTRSIPHTYDHWVTWKLMNVIFY